MTGPDRDDDLADRVLALEQQQRADRRALGSLDADVSDLQAQRRQDVRLLQSLRETQIEHGERLERLGTMTSAGFAVVGARFERLESRVDGLDSRLDGLDSRLDGLDSRLDGVDSRLDGVDSRLDGVDSRLDGLDSRLDGLDSRLEGLQSATSAGFAAVDARLDVIVGLLGGGGQG